jgi:hypothetical protein
VFWFLDRAAWAAWVKSPRVNPRSSDQFICSNDRGLGGGPFCGPDDGRAAGAEASGSVDASQGDDDEVAARDFHFTQPVELEAGDAGVDESADGGLGGGLSGGAGEVDGQSGGTVDVCCECNGDAAEYAAVGSPLEIDGDEPGPGRGSRADEGAAAVQRRPDGGAQRLVSARVVLGFVVEELDAVAVVSGLRVRMRERVEFAGDGRVVGNADVYAGGQDGGCESGEEGGSHAGGQRGRELVVLRDDVDCVDATATADHARVAHAGESPDQGFGLARELLAGGWLGARGVHVLCRLRVRSSNVRALAAHGACAPASGVFCTGDLGGRLQGATVAAGCQEMRGGGELAMLIG